MKHDFQIIYSDIEWNGFRQQQVPVHSPAICNTQQPQTELKGDHWALSKMVGPIIMIYLMNIHDICICHRGLEGRMHFLTFTYNQHFQTYLKDSFVLVSHAASIAIANNDILLWHNTGFHPKPNCIVSTTGMVGSLTNSSMSSHDWFDAGNINRRTGWANR